MLSFSDYFYKVFLEMSLVDSRTGNAESDNKLWFNVKPDNKIELHDDFSYKNGWEKRDGIIDLTGQKIYISSKDLSESWAKNSFAHIKKIQDIIKSIASKVNLNNFGIYMGRYNINSPGKMDFIANYPDILKLSDPVATKGKMTLYHGTNSIYLDKILKNGLQSLFQTGVNQWKTSGRYYKTQKPIYLSSTKERAWEYAESAFRNNPQGQAIVLKVTIDKDESKLFADDDYLDLQETKDLHDWKGSLKQTGQLVYIGRIPAKFISLEYPSEIRPIRKSTFNVVEDLDDISYKKTIQSAFDEDVAEDKIRSAINKLRDDTYFLDDEWNIFRKGDFSDSSFKDAVIEICDIKDQELTLSLKERFNEFSDMDRYYSSIDELWDAYKEESDFEKLFDFEPDEQDDIEHLNSFADMYQITLDTFIKWRADLFE